MKATYLIDGYNLIHALGYLHVSDGSHALEKSRQRLLDFLKDAFGDEAPSVTVVFDASGAPPGSTAWHHFKGIHILFALGKQLADDAIETLLAEHPAPRSLIVISNDHRIQRAARHKGAQDWGCDRFLDELEKRKLISAPPSPELSEKGEPSEADKKHWLEEFKDVADEPGFKELFEPYPFKDED